MRWYQIKHKLDEYESKKALPGIVAIITAILTGLFMSSAQSFWPIVVILIPGCIAAVVLAASLGVECPYCRRRIQYGAYGNSSQIDILRNMHQCPHCQRKFPD